MAREIVLLGLGLSLSWTAAGAADMPQPSTGPAGQLPCKATLTAPAYNGPIKQNPDPACLNVPGLGELYIGGALTGYGCGQTNPFPQSTNSLPNDEASSADLSNLQVFVQKADGQLQFFLQAGAYAIPALGAVNYGSLDQTSLLFGPLPVAYGKIQINDDWSIQGSRLPMAALGGFGTGTSAPDIIVGATMAALAL